MEEFVTGVVELVFSKLLLLHIIDQHTFFRSKAMSFSSTFSGAFSERYPKLFGLLAWEQSYKDFYFSVYNIESMEWLYYINMDCF